MTGIWNDDSKKAVTKLQNEQARENDVTVGDTVLVQRSHKKSKFESNFNPTKCKVISTKGPEVVVQAPGGGKYRRVKNQLKKIPPVEEEEPESDSGGLIISDVCNKTGHQCTSGGLLSDDEPEFYGFPENSTVASPIQTSSNITTESRKSSRNRKLPDKLNDYDLNES